jgi:hypothetical protein
VGGAAGDLRRQLFASEATGLNISEGWLAIIFIGVFIVAIGVINRIEFGRFD